MVVIIPKSCIACKFNQATFTCLNHGTSLCAVDNDGTRVKIGDIAHAINDRPCVEVDVRSPFIVQFNPFSIWCRTHIGITDRENLVHSNIATGCNISQLRGVGCIWRRVGGITPQSAVFWCFKGKTGLIAAP